MELSQRQSIRARIPAAVQETLDQFEVELVQEPPKEYVENRDKELLVSILGFKSPRMSGSLLLGCPDSFLRMSCPGLKADEPDPKPFIYDWIGELSNLISASFKAGLQSIDVDLNLNPPSILEANMQIFDSYAARMPSEILWFAINGQYICVLLCADIDPELDLNQAQDPSEPLLRPGDAVYQLAEKENDMEQPSSSEQTSEVQQPSQTEDDSKVTEQDSYSEEHLKEQPEILTFPLKPGLEEQGDRLGEVRPLSSAAPVNQTNAAKELSPTASHEASKIESVRTTRDHELVLRFAHGVSYTISVQQMIADGISQLSLEGQILCLTKTNAGQLVEVQGLRIEFHDKVAA